MKREGSLAENIYKPQPIPFSTHQIILDDKNRPIDSLFLSVNSAFEEEMGLRTSWVIGKRFTEVFPSLEKELIKLYEQVINGENTSIKWYFQDLERWFYLSLSPFGDSQFVLLFREMEEEKRILPSSKTTLEHIVDHITELVIFLDPTLSIQWINPAGARFFQREKEDLIGRKCYEVWHQRSSICKGCPVVKGMETGLTSFHEMLRYDGRWFRVTGNPVRDREQNLIGAVETSVEITEYLLVENELRERDEQKEALLAAIPDEMVLFDREGTILDFHRGEDGLLLVHLYDVIGKNLGEVLPDPLWQRVMKKYSDLFEERGQMTLFDYHELIQEKKMIFLVRLVPCGRDRALLILRNCTEEREAQNSLEKKTQEMEMLLDHIDIQVYFLVDEKTYGRVNQAHLDFLGINESLIDQEITQILSPSEAQLSITNNQQAFQEKRTTHREEWITDGEGRKRLLSITRTPKLSADHCVEYVVCSAEDITEKREALAKIRYLSFYDKLTDLYNRHYMEEEMRRLDTPRQLPLSLIMGDLNGLKLINDTLGHERGDDLIKKGAHVIKKACRKEDIIARWGGDEFVILLPETGRQETKQIIGRLHKNCEEEDSFIPLSIAFGGATKERVSQSLDDVLKEAEDQMYRDKLLSNRSTRNRILLVLLRVLEEKSCETQEHAWRMQRMAFAMGDVLNLSNMELERLSLLISLHDIGKISIDEGLLKKRGALSLEEWEIVKTHSEVGYRIILSSEEFSPIAEEILTHHEDWDGKGYPRGLKGEEIPLLSRITSIIDAYDVMTTRQFYGEKLTKEEAILELEKASGTQFDPHLVKTFIQILKE